MSIRILVNRKTKKEFKTSDPESVMKRFPRTFILKPAVELSEDILVKEQGIKATIVSEFGKAGKTAALRKTLQEKKRSELDELAKLKGLVPEDYRTKALIIEAIINPAKQDK